MPARLTPWLMATLTALLPFVPLPTAAAGYGNGSGNMIVVGQAIDLSGPNGSIGRDYAAGIKTYFDMLNATGGINGQRVHFISRDDKGLPEVSAGIVAELIERDRVDYLFGGVGDKVTRAVADTPAFQRSTHILFAPLAAERRPDTRVQFWRPGYLQEVRHIFSHFSKLGIADVAVVVQDSPSAAEAQRVVGEEIRTRSLKVAGTARVGMNGEGAAGEALRLAKLKPGFVMIVADTIGTALFLKEFRKHDAQVFVAGTSLTNLDTLKELAGPKSLEWTVFSQVVPNPGAGTSPLQIEHLNMMRKYRDEAVSTLTLEGFAAAKAFALLVQQSRARSLTLASLLARGGTMDTGGLAITPGSHGSLSAYIDIALFRKGSGLMF